MSVVDGKSLMGFKTLEEPPSLPAKDAMRSSYQTQSPPLAPIPLERHVLHRGKGGRRTPSPGPSARLLPDTDTGFGFGCLVT